MAACSHTPTVRSIEAEGQAQLTTRPQPPVLDAAGAKCLRFVPPDAPARSEYLSPESSSWRVRWLEDVSALFDDGSPAARLGFPDRGEASLKG